MARVLGVEVYELLNGERITEPIPQHFEGIVNDIIDESKDTVRKYKRNYVKLWSIIIVLIGIILSGIIYWIIDYYTSPPVFEVMDSYYSKTDEFESTYNYAVEYHGHITDEYIYQHINDNFENYVQITDVDAVLVMFYTNYKGRENEQIYTHITTLFP